MTKDEFNTEWLKVEENCNLFDAEICGKKIWKYIRILSEIYYFDYELEYMYKVGRIWADMPKGNIVDSIFNYIKNPYRDMFFGDNPLFANQTDLLYIVDKYNMYINGKILHPRIGDYISSTPKDISYSIIEWMPLEKHLTNFNLDKKIYYMSHEMITALFKCNNRISEKIVLEEIENKIIKPIEKISIIKFSDKAKACMIDEAIFHIIYGDAYYNFYKYILKKINPKFVIFIHNHLPYMQILMEVCRDKNIQTAEILNGYGLSMTHDLGYSTNVERKYIAPTYYIGHGDASKELYAKENMNCKYGLEEKNCVSIGKIDLNERIKAANKNKLVDKKHKYYLIISSSLPKLIDFTLELAQKLKDKNIKIIYKLHPGEFNNPDPRVKILKEHNVIIKANVPLYNLIEYADLIIGIESAALYESSAFKKPVFIYGKFYKTHPMVEKNTAIGIENVEDFLEKTKDLTNLNINYKAINYFYTDNAKENYQKFLREVINKDSEQNNDNGRSYL